MAMSFRLQLFLLAACAVHYACSHTTEVCNAVSADGKSVKLLAATYHSDNTVIGGVLLTDPNGVTTRYDFDGYEVDENQSPAWCSDPGVNCDCAKCPSATQTIHHWQTVTVSDLVDGTYWASTTTDSQVETPLTACSDGFGSFSVVGSVATASPTAPTVQPTRAPSNNPTTAPTLLPSRNPSTSPTSARPTASPTMEPTAEPSIQPTAEPTIEPSIEPTLSPSDAPSVEPTLMPSPNPTREPTVNPSAYPTANPSVEPTLMPSSNPTHEPTVNPSADPTREPTVNPSADPTSEPTVNPSADPTANPTVNPTVEPTMEPTMEPTHSPSPLRGVDSSAAVEKDYGYLLTILLAGASAFLGCGLAVFGELRRRRAKEQAKVDVAITMTSVNVEK